MFNGSTNHIYKTGRRKRFVFGDTTVNPNIHKNY